MHSSGGVTLNDWPRQLAADSFGIETTLQRKRAALDIGNFCLVQLLECSMYQPSSSAP